MMNAGTKSNERVGRNGRKNVASSAGNLRSKKWKQSYLLTLTKAPRNGKFKQSRQKVKTMVGSPILAKEEDGSIIRGRSKCTRNKQKTTKCQHDLEECMEESCDEIRGGKEVEESRQVVPGRTSRSKGDAQNETTKATAQMLDVGVTAGAAFGKVESSPVDSIDLDTLGVQ